MLMFTNLCEWCRVGCSWCMYCSCSVDVADGVGAADVRNIDGYYNYVLYHGVLLCCCFVCFALRLV